MIIYFADRNLHILGSASDLLEGNLLTYHKMTDNIDFNAGRVITGEASIEELGKELFENMIQVCNGRMTKAESLGHQEFGIFRIGYTF